MAKAPVRLAARVVLLDPDDRVLLMRYDDGPPNGSHWTTPGGGLNEGEDFPAAALRELAEETGWRDIPLRREVLRRSLTMEYAGRLVRQRERLYLARTAQAQRGSTASTPCTRPMASPRGGGGRWPSWTLRPSRSGRRGWPPWSGPPSATATPSRAGHSPARD